VLLATIMTMFFIFSLLVIPVLLLDATPPNNNDLQTLLCVRQHLADPAGLLTTWKNDSLNFCAWSGVSCGKRHKSRVVALNLDSLELSGQIPACIANLTFLARIHLPNNNLTGSIPHELGQLNRLQYLNLSSNYLSGLIPDTLSSCSRLQIVDLGRNSLHGEISTLQTCA
jgi:Leucine-rich repeat (LRR) protein